MARSSRRAPHLPRAFGADARTDAPGGSDQPDAREPGGARRLPPAHSTRLTAADRIGGRSDHVDEDQHRCICRSRRGFRLRGSPEWPLEAGVAIGDGSSAGRCPFPVDGWPVQLRLGAGTGSHGLAFGGGRRRRRLCGGPAKNAPKRSLRAGRGRGRGDDRLPRHRRRRWDAPLRPRRLRGRCAEASSALCLACGGRHPPRGMGGIVPSRGRWASVETVRRSSITRHSCLLAHRGGSFRRAVRAVLAVAVVHARVSARMACGAATGRRPRESDRSHRTPAAGRARRHWVPRAVPGRRYPGVARRLAARACERYHLQRRAEAVAGVGCHPPEPIVLEGG